MLILLILFLVLVSNNDGRVLNDIEKIEVIRIHNFLRRSVVPPASNMNELEYSDEIALVASKYLEKCQFSHMSGPQGYGENGRLSTDNNITTSTIYWFKERINYDWHKPYGKRCYNRNGGNGAPPVCGHYTMVVTNTLQKVGCAINYCPKITIPKQDSRKDAYLTFCFYDKGPRNHPYIAGKPCTGCINENLQFCKNDLCVKKSSSTDCKVVCKRCQKRNKFIRGFCGCDCNYGNDNDCSAPDLATQYPPNCQTCHILGTPCLNGGKDISHNKDECLCECPKGFKGGNCEIIPEMVSNIENAAMIQLQGEFWDSELRIPKDKLEFERKWKSEWKAKLFKSLEELCKTEKCGTLKEKKSHYVLEMVENFPVLNENGSLTIKVYAKNNGEYISKNIVQKILQQLQ